MPDTATIAQALYDEQLKALTHAERLQRTLELSTYVLQLTWAGAERAVGHLGRAAVLQRFFLQTYGPDVPVPPALLAACEQLQDE